MQHVKDNRALFHRRARFAALALCIVTIAFSAGALGESLWRHYHQHN